MTARLKNLYMAPKLKKIVLNMGLGLDGNDSKILKLVKDLLQVLKLLLEVIKCTNLWIDL